jgi:hypothetical protein
MILIIAGFIACFHAGKTWALTQHRRHLRAVLSQDEKLAIHFAKTLIAFKRKYKHLL